MSKKADKTEKTNALRMLDRLKLSYSLAEYDVDEDDLSGAHAAEVSGLDPDMMYKTLVAKGDRTGFVVACIPVLAELELKELARVSGNKSVEMLHVKDLFEITGYIRGGCSPIGMKKAFPTFIDTGALKLEKVAVSAGRRGLQMILAPEDLIKAAGAKTAELIRTHG